MRATHILFCHFSCDYTITGHLMHAYMIESLILHCVRADTEFMDFILVIKPEDGDIDLEF